MFKKTLLLLVLAFSCFLSSCRAVRQETQKTESEQRFTSEKVVTYKDTTLFAPKAETSIKIPLTDIGFKSDLKTVSKPKVFTQTSGQAKVKIRIVHDTIQATATCDSLAIVAKVKNELLKETSSVISKSNSDSKKKTGYTFFHLIIAFVLGFGLCYVLKFFKIV